MMIAYRMTAADRARLLLKKLGPKKTSEHGEDYERWRSVQYALWLASGQIAPEVGQTSPDCDEADRNLSQPNGG